jgi:EAL and modified HD-GYP domain-containing signal transduction protein
MAAARVFVARQPIFTGDRHVYAYELLFRNSADNFFPDVEGSNASAALMADAILMSGLDTLSGARPAFINFTRELLLGEFYAALPRDRIVVELLEDVPADDEVLAACRQLKERGYRLALDDIGAPTERDMLLAPFADIIKVDLRATTRAQRAELTRSRPMRHCRFLAEKVETSEEFDECVALGYQYFQGYLLRRPEMTSRPGMHSFAPTVARLLAAVGRAEIDFDELDAITRTDVALCYKFLQFANAAANGLRVRIASVRDALVLLGRDQIVRAVALLTIGGLLDRQPSELTVRSLVRAKLLESLGGSHAVSGASLDLFLLGMFSGLHAILGESFVDVLSHFPLSDAVRQSLLGAPGRLQRAVDLVVAYERGEWPAVLGAASELGLDASTIPHRYLAAVAFADSAMVS